MIVHLTPIKNVLSAEVEFEFYFSVLEKGDIINPEYFKLNPESKSLGLNTYWLTQKYSS